MADGDRDSDAPADGAVHGPLTGIRVVELAAIGPAPYGVMLLSDLGAEVVRIDRASDVHHPEGASRTSIGMSRNRRSVAVDLKHDEGVAVVRRLAAEADVFVEGFRPGVAERLGVGPDVLCSANPGLVYARMTGWGQDGPLADRAGHDIDYAALAGALQPVGRPDDTPPPPLNFLADFGGGGVFLALGVLAALFERAGSGRGQIVDAAMVDGTASLTAFLHGLLADGAWTPRRGANLLDGAAPFYDTYRCADGRFVAVGAIEPQFYAALLDGLGLDAAEWPQHDRSRWPQQKAELAEIFATRSRDEWEEVFAGSDACVAPVLEPREAVDHPHNRERGVFVDVDGTTQPAPAPRLERTPGTVRRPAPAPGEHTDQVLAEFGYDAADLTRLRRGGAVA